MMSAASTKIATAANRPTRRGRTREPEPSVGASTPGPSDDCGELTGSLSRTFDARRSAAFLALLAGHGQGRPREGFEPRLGDRLAAALAVAVRPGVDAFDRVTDLGQQIEAVGRDRHLL